MLSLEEMFTMHVRGLIFSACAAVSLSCASDSGAEPASSAAAEIQPFASLPLPQRGFQVRDVGTMVEPGQDVEYCEVAQLPGTPDDTYYVRTLELANLPNSHHLIVSAAPPGSSAEQRAQAMGVGQRAECISAEQIVGQGLSGVGGIQSQYAKTELPEGVGKIFHGGQYLVFDYHYLNTRDVAVQAQSAVNFHLEDAGSIRHPASGFGFRNYAIATPAQSTGSFTGECRFKSDLMVSEVTRHTHRWGTDFTVWWAGGAHDGEQIWTSHDWEQDITHAFDAPQRLRAGEGFRFRCDYQNSTDHVLRFGTQASDEMCILFGTAWEAEEGQNLGPLDCDIVWIDAAGVGHEAKAAGGFPAPSAQQQQACLGGSDASSACARCRCEACASPVIQCVTDSDCSPISQCFRDCPSGSDCFRMCQDALDGHSSGLGPFVQMSRCFSAQCSDACK
jgi:hypothetical protein